ncbi:MAG: diaminopimelate epimerase [Flavobacteriales bacterium]|nr:diaminopimelate epimerase [Flavobacteriales bacterium]
MIDFYKYQGAGNDFIMIDNRLRVFEGDKVAFAQKWCDRKFGIGSDGLIFIEEHADLDFVMDFYNPDGSQSFCGNGSRCAMAFAGRLGIIEKGARFEAIDGEHEAHFTNKGVKVKMGDVASVDQINEDHFIDTGSPHYISYEEGEELRDIVDYGKAIRYSDQYKEEGTNVNLIEVVDAYNIRVRTYERGVEDETFACGTGATACGLSFGFKTHLNEGPVEVEVKGGHLTIHFSKQDEGFSNVWLEGPAEYVFKGVINE